MLPDINRHQPCHERLKHTEHTDALTPILENNTLTASHANQRDAELIKHRNSTNFKTGYTFHYIKHPLHASDFMPSPKPQGLQRQPLFHGLWQLVCLSLHTQVCFVSPCTPKSLVHGTTALPQLRVATSALRRSFPQREPSHRSLARPCEQLRSPAKSSLVQRPHRGMVGVSSSRPPPPRALGAGLRAERNWSPHPISRLHICHPFIAACPVLHPPAAIRVSLPRRRRTAQCLGNRDGRGGRRYRGRQQRRRHWAHGAPNSG
eukprot:350468-Chlamydomonas_euryale.AAC.3